MRFVLFLLCFFTAACQAPIPKKPDLRLRVMIIDTGLDGSIGKLHDVVPMQFRNPKDLIDQNGHGTHVFGLIAAQTCPQVELIPCRGFTEAGHEGSFACMRRAVDLKVDVVNYSAGGGAFIQEEFDAIERMAKHNILLVTAAGNNGLPYSQANYYPAAYDLPNIIAVGALASAGLPAKFTNGRDVNLAWERGVGINSTGLRGRSAVMNGTSQAAALHTAKIVKLFCDFQKKSLTVTP